MSIEDLAALCLVWQQRLRLRDWEVRVRLVARGDINVEAYGEITWLRHSKTASISLVESADMAVHDPEYDQERTLVHELLHIALIAWKTETGSAEDIAQEQAIWAIARALVALSRERHEAPP